MPDCPYSAKKIYSGFLDKGLKGWPLDVLAADVTEENIAEALRTGPYGRCVYECDNDPADHSILGGHGGGDYGLMKAFVGAIANNDPSLVLSGPAETARREERVVRI